MKKTLLILFFTLYTLLTQSTLYSQWVQQTIPISTSHPIKGIKFIDTLSGWSVSGTNTPPDTAFIFHTTNGGTNWSTQFSIYPFQFTSLSIVNNLVGYAGGDSIGRPKLFKTTDGGINWFTLPVNNNMAFFQLFFLNVDTGWENGAVVGPDIRLTTDGGLTWQVRTNGINNFTGSLFFLNFNTGWCAGQDKLYQTTNAGQNWFVSALFSPNDISSIFFLNVNTGWVGFNLSLDQMKYTSNGGINWINQTLPVTNNTNVFDITFFNNLTGYAGTSLYYRIFKTTDGGFNWGFQIDSSPVHVSFSDSLHGWTGALGISHTSNGGGQITYVGIINISSNLPEYFELFQNHPNPFNSQTNIRFSLTKTAYVKFKIYDVLGKEKAVWQTNKLLTAGTHELQYDAIDLASGIYFLEFEVKDESSIILYRKTRKMVLLK